MVSYDDLTAEQQAAFDEVQQLFEDGVDSQAAQELYAAGIQVAIEEGSYAAGLADRFGLSENQIATADEWANAVQDFDPADWSRAAQRAGVSEKFVQNYVVGITED